MTKKKILAISGSTRINSSNEAILKLVARLYSEQIDVQIFNQLETLPHFNPDIDDEHVSQAVRDFRELIRNADGVLICTPEYVFSLPGALKTALEWTVSTTVFSDKPFAYIVASGLGEKTFESLELIMNTILQYKIGSNSKLLIQGARAKLKNGELIDPTVLAEIKNVVDALILQISSV
jgi:chromate reductase